MGRVFLAIALCLGLTASVAADEWEPLSENETAIQFNAPGLARVRGAEGHCLFIS